MTYLMQFVEDGKRFTYKPDAHPSSYGDNIICVFKVKVKPGIIPPDTRKWWQRILGIPNKRTCEDYIYCSQIHPSC